MIPSPSLPVNTPGLQDALADNPGCADLLRALAAAPDRAPARSVAPAVLAAARRDLRLRSARRALLASAAAAAVAAFFLLPGSVTPAVPAGNAATGAVAATGRSNALDALAANGTPAAAPSPRGLPPKAGGGVIQHSAFSIQHSLSALAASQRPDGSWAPESGGEALAPAATGLAVLRLAASGDPSFESALQRAAAWLRANQNADGTFGAAAPAGPSAAHNLAIPAVARLRLYESGSYPELFTPIDGAVGAVRARLAAEPRGAAVPQGEVWLAAALALADSLEWSDAHSGDLRRALLRIDGSGDARLASVAAAPTLAAKREALLRLRL